MDNRGNRRNIPYAFKNSTSRAGYRTGREKHNNGNNEKKDNVNVKKAINIIIAFLIIFICVCSVASHLIDRHNVSKELISIKAENVSLEDSIEQKEMSLDNITKYENITAEAKDQFKMQNGDNLSGVTIYVRALDETVTVASNVGGR